MDKNMIFKLETADTKRCGTTGTTTWTAIFVQRNFNQLNDTEKRVIRMLHVFQHYAEIVRGFGQVTRIIGTAAEAAVAGEIPAA